MRYQIIAAALAIGLAGPAFAQNRTLPAGSEAAAQPPIDWSAATARSFEAPGVVFEGRSIAAEPQGTAPRADRSDDSD